MSGFDLEFFRKELPRLIREDDAVKGALITAFSSIMPTHEDFQSLSKQISEQFAITNKRLDQVDKRLDQVDKRLDQVDKHLDQVDKHLDQIDKRFEELIDSMNKKFDAQMELIKMLKLDVMRIESKEGHAIEVLIRDLMRKTLQLNKINPESIKTVSLVDEEGVVFHKNYASDIDIFMENGDLCLIELKAKANSYDLAHFLLNVKLYTHLYQRTPTKLILAAIRINSSLIKEAERQNVELLWGEIVDL